MSGPRRRASAAPASPEKVLFRAYGEVKPGETGVFRVGKEAACACGGVISVDWSVESAVIAHNLTPKHVAWRAWREA